MVGYVAGPRRRRAQARAPAPALGDKTPHLQNAESVAFSIQVNSGNLYNTRARCEHRFNIRGSADRPPPDSGHLCPEIRPAVSFIHIIKRK